MEHFLTNIIRKINLNQLSVQLTITKSKSLIVWTIKMIILPINVTKAFNHMLPLTKTRVKKETNFYIENLDPC